jgi:hypothetical protein
MSCMVCGRDVGLSVWSCADKSIGVCGQCAGAARTVHALCDAAGKVKNGIDRKVRYHYGEFYAVGIPAVNELISVLNAVKGEYSAWTPERMKLVLGSMWWFVNRNEVENEGGQSRRWLSVKRALDMTKKALNEATKRREKSCPA